MVALGSLSHQEGNVKEEKNCPNFFLKKMFTFISLTEHHKSLRRKRSILIMCLAFFMLCWMACEVMEFSCFSAVIVFIAWPCMKLLMSKNLRMVEI